MEGIIVQNLVESLHMYEHIWNQMDIGIHIIDAKGRTVVYNERMAEIERMNPQDVLHKNVMDVFSFHDKQSSTLLDALHFGKSRKNNRQTYYNQHGKEINTVNTTTPIIVDGTILGAMEIVYDVTLLKQHITEEILGQREQHFTFSRMIAISPAMDALVQEARRAARTSSSILLVGETGTGKDVLAQCIHNESARAGKPFVSQNCAAMPESLIESMLFGTEKGAFTGAIQKAGLFEEAGGGTLLLDEINSLATPMQAKLLRVIQERLVRRVGGSQEKKVNVRLMSTINEDPIEAIAANRLRKDLYYRLGVVTLFLPPLRERREDLNLLTAHFIRIYNERFHLQVVDIDERLRRCFHEYDWPGNVRELQHLIEGAMNLVDKDSYITLSHMPVRFANSYQAPQEGKQSPLKRKIEETEKEYLTRLLREQNGNITQTAQILGMSRQSLQYRIKKYELKKDMD